MQIPPPRNFFSPPDSRPLAAWDRADRGVPADGGWGPHEADRDPDRRDVPPRGGLLASPPGRGHGHGAPMCHLGGRGRGGELSFSFFSRSLCTVKQTKVRAWLQRAHRRSTPAVRGHGDAAAQAAHRQHIHPIYDITNVQRLSFIAHRGQGGGDGERRA